MKISFRLIVVLLAGFAFAGVLLTGLSARNGSDRPKTATEIKSIPAPPVGIKLVESPKVVKPIVEPPKIAELTVEPFVFEAQEPTSLKAVSAICAVASLNLDEGATCMSGGIELIKLGASHLEIIYQVSNYTQSIDGIDRIVTTRKAFTEIEREQKQEQLTAYSNTPHYKAYALQEERKVSAFKKIFPNACSDNDTSSCDND